MGCDQLLCSKCGVSYSLEGGDVFWLWDFISEHWHIKSRAAPHKGMYLTVRYDELPKHLHIKHRVPEGTIWVAEAPIHVIGERQRFSLGALKSSIRNIKRYNTRWTRFKDYLGTIWYAIRGHALEDLDEKQPRVLKKEKDDWMIEWM